MVEVATQDQVEDDTVIRQSYSKGRVWLLMSVVIGLGIANAFGALGGTILLGPTIQKDLNMSTDELQWLTTSFYIPLASLPVHLSRIAFV
jgi:hypothetical protein